MTARRALAVLGLLALLLPAGVAAQGLGDVAARERQKRQAAGQKEKPRVLDNDDLRREEPKKPSEGDAAEETPPAASYAPRGVEREDEDDGEPDETASRRARMEQAQREVDAAQAGVATAEETLKGIQDKLNPMSPSYIFGNPLSGDAVAEEARTREELRQAEAQLAQAREALAKATQAREDLRRGRWRTENPD